MKRIAQSFFLALFTMFVSSFSCGQNGPTQPSVSLSWTQSVTAGVTANCVYRGSASGKYDLPALFCSAAPITSFSDTTVVRGTTYHYAVTAQVAKTESGYSNDSTAPVPLSPAAPSLNPPIETKAEPGDKVENLVARVDWISVDHSSR